LLDGVDDPALATDVRLERASLLLLRARLHSVLGDTDAAFPAAHTALEALDPIPPFERARIGRLLPDIYLLLARLSVEKETAADYILKAAEQPTLLTPLLSELATATATLLASDQPADRALAFISKLTPAQQARGAHTPAFFFSRSPAQASTLIKASTRLMEALIGLDSPSATSARETLVRTAATCLDLLRRRPVVVPPATRQREMFRLLAETSGLLQTAQDASPPPTSLRDLSRATAELDARFGGPDEPA
jgi:hypothetical protein